MVPVRTAEEMRKAVLNHAIGCSVVIKAAAVSDYRAQAISQKKIKKDNFETTLALERTKDILEELGRNKGDRILVGFAAETEDLVPQAKKKLMKKNLDFIVANDISQPRVGFGSETNQVKILFPSGQVKDFPLMQKEEVAQLVFDEVVELLNKRKSNRKK
jgi:phosphopantothenoylcysteine decarboxylase/phosphopantothenate--cysteine ligase